MSRFKRVHLPLSLVAAAALAVAAPLVAQIELDPRFVHCHGEAMERYESGDYEDHENDALFKLCLDYSC